MTGSPTQTAAGARSRPLPKFLELWAIRFPIGAIASIGHRVSGVLLLIALPLLARALETSLRSEADYRALLTTGSVWSRVAAVLLAWAAAHHVAAGVRHLLMDAGIGVRLARARASAWAVILAGVAVAAYVALGVFR